MSEREDEHSLWQDYFVAALEGLAGHTSAMFVEVNGPDVPKTETTAEDNCRTTARAVARMASYIADEAFVLDRARKREHDALAEHAAESYT